MKVIKSEKLTTRYQERFICIDEDTGEILDDAQGYGYKTPQKAYAAYAYKHKSEETIAKENRVLDMLEEYIQNNQEEYKKFHSNVEDICWYGMEDGDDEWTIKHAVWHEAKLLNFPYEKAGIKPSQFLKYDDLLTERKKKVNKNKNKKQNKKNHEE